MFGCQYSQVDKGVDPGHPFLILIQAIDLVKERQRPVQWVQRASPVGLPLKAMDRARYRRWQKASLNKAFANRVDDGLRSREAVVRQISHGSDGKARVVQHLRKTISIVQALVVCPDTGKGSCAYGTPADSL